MGVLGTQTPVLMLAWQVLTYLVNSLAEYTFIFIIFELALADFELKLFLPQVPCLDLRDFGIDVTG